MAANVSAAVQDDIPSWLELAQEVVPLFGAMPMFSVTLENKIARGEALCARAPNRSLSGGVLLGGISPEFWIRWLAVRRSVHRQGIGTALVSAAVDRCTAPCTISLATFGEDLAAGNPARALYKQMGFRAGEMLPRGPEGGTRQLFVLERA